MRGVHRFVFIITLAGWGFIAPASFAIAEDDEWLGLPAGEGREEVFNTCQACHSLKTVKQQGLNRNAWDETFVWMVEEQEMDKPEAKDRALMLNYLSTYYGRDRLAYKMRKK